MPRNKFYKQDGSISRRCITNDQGTGTPPGHKRLPQKQAGRKKMQINKRPISKHLCSAHRPSDIDSCDLSVGHFQDHFSSWYFFRRSGCSGDRGGFARRYGRQDHCCHHCELWRALPVDSALRRPRRLTVLLVTCCLPPQAARHNSSITSHHVHLIYWNLIMMHSYWHI